MQIKGLSMAARAEPVTDPKACEQMLARLIARYPPQDGPALSMPKPDEIRVFRLTPTVISVLDYSKGFGHTDLVAC